MIVSLYTFYVDGVEKEVTVQANNERDAHKMAFDQLSDEEKNACACLDLVDTKECFDECQ